MAQPANVHRFPGPNGARRAVTLGMLVDWLEDDYQNVVLEGAVQAARQRGANLICFAGGALGKPEPTDGSAGVSSRRFGRRNAIYDLVSPDCVDGLMILSGTLGNYVGRDQLIRFCERYRPLPMCSIAVSLPGMPSVLVDNAAGMRAAVAHLIADHGLRRIAFIRGPLANEEAERRYRIYRDVLAEYGIPIDQRLVVIGDFQRASGFEAVRELYDERAVKVDAIVAASDYMALGAMDALSVRGFNVPRDVAVVGFDDIEEARSEIPPLTTVRQPLFDQGQWAAEALLDLIHGRPTPERVVLHTEFVRRRSCGCSRALELQSPNGEASEADPAAELSILEHAVSVQAGQRLAARRFSRALAETGDALLTALDMESLGRAMSQRLPGLGISSAYVAVYEGDVRPSERAHLAVNLDEGTLLEPGGMFRSRELLPAALRPASRRFAWVVEPLVFKDEQLGFAVLELGASDGVVYESLRDQISAAMKSALLARQVAESEREVQALRRLLELTPELLASRPVEELGRVILSEAAEAVFGADSQGSLPGGFLALRGAGVGGATVLAAIGSFASSDGAANVPAELLGAVDAALASREPRAGGETTIVPIALGDGALGALFFAAPVRKSSDLTLLQAFARPLAAAIDGGAIRTIASDRSAVRVTTTTSSRAAGRSSSD